MPKKVCVHSHPCTQEPPLHNTEHASVHTRVLVTRVHILVSAENAGRARERDNISLNSVSRACAVDKQQEKELAVFRLMGGRCAEKKHRSNSVLLNALRRKPARCECFATGRDGLCDGGRVVSITTCVNSGTRCGSTTITQFEL